MFLKTFLAIINALYQCLLLSCSADPLTRLSVFVLRVILSREKGFLLLLDKDTKIVLIMVLLTHITHYVASYAF